MTTQKSKKNDDSRVLKNHGLIDTIIEKARIQHSDTVLEIAPKNGAITMKLLQKARKVIAFEDDTRAAKELLSKVERSGDLKNKLKLTSESILHCDIPRFDVCISNLPFSISVPVILRLLSCDFRCAYVLVQKEFGARLVARPGSSDYSRLSVVAQLMAQIEHVMKVSRNSFLPAPQVDSCFMKIEPQIPRPQIDVVEFDNMLKICFGRKNKTLAANLKSSVLEERLRRVPGLEEVGVSEFVDSLLSEIGLTEARTAKMEIEDFLALLLEFKKIGVSFK